MSVFLTGTVGRNGANIEQDVKAVQRLLQQWALHPAERKLDPGKDDGDCGARTLVAIRTFQARLFDRPDGRIDPGGRTHANLVKVTPGAGVCTQRPGRIDAGNLVRVLLPHQGERYVLGAAVPKYFSNWCGPWDCAEFVAWGIYQVTGRLVGCRWTKAPNGIHYMNSYTGWFGLDLPSVATEITQEEAVEVPGTVLLRLARGKGQIGHIAVSRGGNQTIEAAGAREDVAVKRIKGRNWTSYWRLNFLDYQSQCNRI